MNWFECFPVTDGLCAGALQALRGNIDALPADLILLLALVFLGGVVALCVRLYTRARYSNSIRRMLYTDGLTGLLSAQGFEDGVKKLLRSGDGRRYLLLDFDISSFQMYNRLYGFEQGNELLRRVARITLRRCEQARGICARVESDHFVVMEPLDGDPIRRVQELDAQLRAAADRDRQIQLWYGAFVYDSRQMSTAAMRDCALAAKRSVKGSFDRRIGVYDEAMHERLQQDTELMERAGAALRDGEMQVYYQPQYDIPSEKMIGAEALCRWVRPDGDITMPGRFIKLLEDNGLIADLDIFMFTHVCEKQAKLAAAGLGDFILSVNLSRAHLYDARLPEKLAAIARAKGAAPTRVEIELTESAFYDNQARMMAVMERLHEKGFRISIDDFGSGFSSLNMLKDIRFDAMKIDRGFLGDVSRNDRARKVIVCMISLARELGIRTVAEGIETRAQLDFLRRQGCDVAQGFLFSKPLPEPSFDALLDAAAT